MMVETAVFYPENAKKFHHNVQRRWQEYMSNISHYNSEHSLSQRTDKVLIYHVLDGTVFINRPGDDMGRVNITAQEGKVGLVKSLLEEITRVKLVRRI